MAHAGGAPELYTHKLAEKVCSYIADGLSLRSIQKISGMPSRFTIFNWLKNKPEFLNLYVRAKEDCAEHFAEEMVEIADDAQVLEDSAAVNRARLRVDTRKWIASKLKPKKYGEHLEIDQHVSADSILVSIEGKEMLKLQVTESRENK